MTKTKPAPAPPLSPTVRLNVASRADELADAIERGILDASTVAAAYLRGVAAGLRS